MYSLPDTYLPYIQDVEDSFVHKTLNAMFSTVFTSFEFEWANKHAEGSKERRGKDGLKPDLQLSIEGRVVLFMEVKPPGPNQHESDYLSDKWKLFNLAKDEIDRSLRQHVFLPFIVTIQVYGKWINGHYFNCIPVIYFILFLKKDIGWRWEQWLCGQEYTMLMSSLWSMFPELGMILAQFGLY